MRTLIGLVMLWSAAATALPLAQDEGPTPAVIDRAVSRAVPLLQASADAWYEKRSCSSCHHQALGLMTTAVLQERGFETDAARVGGLRDRIIRVPRNWLEHFVTGEVSINETIGQSYRAIGYAAGGGAASPATDAMLHLLAGRQHENGRWSSYSHRPPHEDSEVTATALTIRAISLFKSHTGRQRELEGRLARARTWLERAAPASTEDQSMQLLGLGWAGAAPESMADQRRALLLQQRPDGGWAQIPTRASDAYATGQALVALNQAAGLPPTDAAYRRGVAFLLRTQLADGSWLVTTRRTFRQGLEYFESGFPHGKHQFISYAGSAWAVMALALTRGDDQSRALMGQPHITIDPLPALPPDGLTPLARAALFGSLDEMQAALETAADVNASSPGGITALMAAAHDPAKVGRLLAAGADPRAVAASGHTALQLASAYSGARESVAQLLARGVPVDVPVTRGNLGLTALGAAVMRGDTETATLLLRHGAKVDGVSGKFVSPLIAATFQGDGEMVAWLLDRGASVDAVVTDELAEASTALMIAAEDGATDVVATLLKHGAAVNAIDGAGRTALMYAAASIDRGDTAIVDLLLAAGAKTPLRDPEGRTAADLAVRFNRLLVAKRLDATQQR